MRNLNQRYTKTIGKSTKSGPWVERLYTPSTKGKRQCSILHRFQSMRKDFFFLLLTVFIHLLAEVWKALQLQCCSSHSHTVKRTISEHEMLNRCKSSHGCGFNNDLITSCGTLFGVLCCGTILNQQQNTDPQPHVHCCTCNRTLTLPQRLRCDDNRRGHKGPAWGCR